LKYRLSDEEVLKLNLLIPVSQFKYYVGDYCPSKATIYRTLNKYKIDNPLMVRKEFDRTIFKAGANDLTDKERDIKIEEIKREVLQDTVSEIHRRAKRYQELTK
jgi:uncharacterized membrane-anchored protein YjiN (DUF445 family)